MVAYGYQHRVLMTGTPLQNNTSELFSLLNFIEPAKFPDAEKFSAQFGTITTQDPVCVCVCVCVRCVCVCVCVCVRCVCVCCVCVCL